MSEMVRLEGKVAFITGGSSGIGLGIARACLEEGMKVAMSYLTPSHLDSAREYLTDDVLAFSLDVRDRRGMQRVAQQIEHELGPVQLLVNNAGIGIKSTLLNASEADWNYALDVNLRGVINGIQTFVPRMLKAGRPAHIVSTASMSGLAKSGSAGVYATTKYAVVGMMESLRTELAPHGIGVSAFCPGVVRSRIAHWDRHLPGHEQTETEPAPAGMDPLECGRRVLLGVKDNALFILTHSEFRELIKKRCQTIVASFQDGEEPEERVRLESPLLQEKLYQSELARLRESERR